MSLQSRLSDFITAVGADIKLASGFPIAFSSSGVLAVKVGAAQFPIADGTYTIVSVTARVGTAPTGSAVTVDVNVNGTTIYTNQVGRPTIAAGANVASGATPAVNSVTTGNYISVDIDTVGSTVSGSDLTVVIRLKKTA